LPSRPTVGSAPSGPAASSDSKKTLELYREALRLELTRPTEALAKYQEIKHYPQELWPSDLEGRINGIEKRLKSPK
jgi:hypothetical protein